jgi:hypothetical protein
MFNAPVPHWRILAHQRARLPVPLLGWDRLRVRPGGDAGAAWAAPACRCGAVARRRQDGVDQALSPRRHTLRRLKKRICGVLAGVLTSIEDNCF